MESSLDSYRYRLVMKRNGLKRWRPIARDNPVLNQTCLRILLRVSKRDTPVNPSNIWLNSLMRSCQRLLRHYENPFIMKTNAWRLVVIGCWTSLWDTNRWLVDEPLMTERSLPIEHLPLVLGLDAWVFFPPLHTFIPHLAVTRGLLPISTGLTLRHGS